MQVDQKDRRERRAFNRDPHHAEIVRRHREEHRENEQMKEREKQTRASKMRIVKFGAHETERVQRGNRAEQSDDEHHQRGERIHAQKFAERDERRASPHRPSNRDANTKRANCRERVNHFHQRARPHQANQSRREKRNRQQGNPQETFSRHHPFNSPI